MHLYRVKIWYTTHVTREIEAHDTEEAEYLAVMAGITPDHEQEALENLEAMEFNNEVTLADHQYTDQQELQDRERDHDNKQG